MGGILLWIVLIFTVLATGFIALTSSGTGRLWDVDVVELRRRQRSKQVLFLHVDAIRWLVSKPRRRYSQGRSLSASPLAWLGSRSGSFMSRVGHPSHETYTTKHPLAGG
ncbi:hypothetical protein PV721_20970 [Streptomyces sp. MB09-01]|uniref:hypothetical protein n=1 Tax=Streptomyces sp. MB09-01 TaxID=3028666 RepID=UPI0029A2553F|nr:hypothetical protein [Streptomyces sp. MB09-01]MDX3536803.1 hypothetical protein [Streptomyces sp. MB09-01]